MASLDLEAENEKMIESSTARLRSLSYSLGVAAETLAVEEGTKLIEDCRTAVSLRQKAEEELAEVKAFIADYEARKAEKTAVEREEKALQSSIRLLSIRLGAVLYEQCSFSLLDKDCFSAIYNDISSSTEGRKSFLSRFARKSSDDRFLSYASRVLAENLDSRMQGGAKELLEEIREMQRKDAVLVGRITELSGYLDDNKQSYSMSVRQGLDDSRRNLAKLQADEERKFVSFGSYLYENGSEWISESTPSSILDMLQALLSEHDRYSALIDRRMVLRKKERADSVRAMIESEEKKIRILEAEKARIDDEIAGIKEEIDRLRLRLDSFSR